MGGALGEITDWGLYRLRGAGDWAWPTAFCGLTRLVFDWTRDYDQVMATQPAARTFRNRVLISTTLVVLSLLVGGTAMAYLASLREPAAVREPAPRQYNVEVFQVQPHNLQELVSAFGAAQADRRVILAAQVAGEIVEIHPELKVGTLVRSADVTSSDRGSSEYRPGETLVVIDPRTYQERVIQVEGMIAEARAELVRLDQEEQNLRRLKQHLEDDLSDLREEYAKIADLVTRKINTDSDLRRARLELRTIETRLVQNQNENDLLPTRREQAVRRISTLQNDLEVARHDRERTTVRPPFSGRLAEVSVELGQFVRPGDPLVTLTDATVVEVPLSVSLDDYARLAPFVKAGRFPLAVLSETETSPPRWHGQLVRVAPQADERTRTVMLYVRVDNREHETPLLPGMFVHARIDGPLLSQVLVVPRDAVLSGRGFVLVDGHATRRDVTLSRTLYGFAVVESGFEPGDRVILSNLDVLYEGAPVTAIEERGLSAELQRQTTPLLKLLD